MSLRRAGRLVKLACFSLLPLVTLLAVVEVAVRVYFYQRHSPYATGMAQLYAKLRPRPTDQRAGVTTVLTAEPVFQPDAVVGYRGVPGTHAVTFVREDRRLSSTVMFGEDGYRTTSPNSAKDANRPGLWIFGGSAPYGYGLSNEDTLPWLVQDALPDWAVRNFAMPGFGNLQALLQLTSASEKRETLPAVAVFMYEPIHRRRNIGAPAFLAAVLATAAQFSTPSHFYDRKYARARIDETGSFVVDFVDLSTGSWKEDDDAMRDDSAAEGSPNPDDGPQAIVVTKVIFHRLWTLCRSCKILPVFAVQSGTLDDPIVRYATRIGFRVIDISIDLADGDTLRPIDGHPNRRGNVRYRDRLLTGLAPLLKSLGRAPGPGNTGD
jgi:hypothetical protein